AHQFGDSSTLADELSSLILKGTKTATCSALWEWEAEGSPLPEVGLKAIVIDGNEQPICIIEITQVSIKPYIDVDAQFAYNEGECDRSLEFWRQEHWNYFSRVLPKIGKYPIPEMLLVCEYFRVVYK
ncbi:MAG: ASCH domain-containing protein, partial [Sphaerospermopsis kisseleviana]